MNKLTHEWTKDWHVDHVLKNIPKTIEGDIRYARQRGFNFMYACLKEYSCITYLMDGIPMAIVICPTKDDPTLWAIFTNDALKIRFTLYKYTKIVLNNIIRELGLTRGGGRETNDGAPRWLGYL